MQFVALFDLIETEGPNAITKLDEEFGKGRAGFYPGDIVIYSEFKGKIHDVLHISALNFIVQF